MALRGQQIRSLVALLLMSGAAGIFGGCPWDGFAPPSPVYKDQTTIVRLAAELSRTTEQQLEPREQHELRIHLEAGRALRATAEQLGLDVVLALFGPDGKRLVNADSPTAGHGPETICYEAQVSGEYRLGIRAWNKMKAGRYTLEAHRLAVADSKLTACQSALVESENLRRSRSRLSHGDRGEAWRNIQTLWATADAPVHEAVAWGEVCRALASQGELLAARNCYQRASDSLRKTGRQILEADLLNRLGLVQRRLGEILASRTSLEAALNLARKTGDLRSEAMVSSSLALLLQDRGDPFRAQILHENTLEIWTSLDEPQNQASALQYLGQLQTELGRFSEAKNLLTAALAIRERFGRQDLLASNLVDLGWTYVQSGDPEQAVPILRRAELLYRELGNVPGRAAALDRLGTAEKENGEVTMAMRAYQSALELSKRQGDERGLAHGGTNLGWLLVDEGQYAAAKIWLGQSKEIFRALEEPDGLAHTLVAEAVLAWKDGRPLEARQQLEEALGIVETIRGRAREQGSYLRAIHLWQGYHDRYLDLLIELHQGGLAPDGQREAFLADDLSRAQSLYQLIRESQVDLRRTANPEILERESALRGQLADLRRSKKELQDAKRTRAIDQRIGEIRRDLDSTRAWLRREHPRFVEIINPSSLSLAEIRAALAPDAQLLSFCLGESRSHAFLLDQSSLLHFELPPRQRIETQARLTHRVLTRSDQRTARRQAELAAEELSRLILAPVIDQLMARRLFVVAEGPLLYIPFAALPVPAAGPSGTQTLMGDRFEVSHLPSASVLVALRHRARHRKDASELLAVVADPVYSAGDPRVSSSRLASGSTQRVEFPDDTEPPNTVQPSLGRLPFTRFEADGILDLVAPENRLTALGFEARRDKVINGELTDYRIVHFAAHALIDEDRPELSGIALSSLDPSGQPIEGHLGLQDIYSLDLPADLVILSGCRTALGQPIQGEGLIGLSQGFFYAGSSNLVVSLWDVDDEATSVLMQLFYRELLVHGLSPAAALQKAQQVMRADPRWKAPFFWAGFVLIGSSTSF